MPQFTPQQLEAYVEAHADKVGTRAYLTERKHNRLREMWCAARFGVGYTTNFGDCFVEIEEADEQREYDFHLLVGALRMPFQVTEVLDTGRRRGNEYREHSEDEVAQRLSLIPRRDSTYAAQRVVEELQSKASKRYAGAQQLHMLLYLNLSASSVPWASLAGPAENEARAFASVWLLAQDVFCCIWGGQQWPGLIGWRAVEGMG